MIRLFFFNKDSYNLLDRGRQKTKFGDIDMHIINDNMDSEKVNVQQD